MMLKKKHEKTTGRPLDNDLSIMLLMQTTVGPLQQHLRLNVRIEASRCSLRCLGVFTIKSRHVTAPSGRSGHPGQADMDIGVVKGKTGWKRTGMNDKRMYKGKAKDTEAKECTRAKEKERAKDKGNRKGMKGKGQGCFLRGGSTQTNGAKRMPERRTR